MIRLEQNPGNGLKIHQLLVPMTTGMGPTLGLMLTRNVLSRRKSKMENGMMLGATKTSLMPAPWQLIVAKLYIRDAFQKKKLRR